MPTPSPAATGCHLKPRQPAAYFPLCASRATETECVSALYEPSCYWTGAPPATPSGCTAGMKAMCGGAAGAAQGVADEASCRVCLVEHANALMTLPQTGTYYNCGATDFTAYCKAEFPAPPPPGHKNATLPCRLRAGQPRVYGVLCASRDTQADCTNPLYEFTCYWTDSAPKPTPPGCLRGMAQFCPKENGQDAPTGTGAGGSGSLLSSPEQCEQCLVAHAKALMTEPQTGTYYDCSATDFTAYCTNSSRA